VRKAELCLVISKTGSMKLFNSAAAMTLLVAFTFSCSKDKDKNNNGSGDPTNPSTSTPGTVTTIAGSVQGDVNGTGSAAQLRYPNGITMDAAGNLYVADMDNEKIKKISPSGVVTTFAGSVWGDVDATGTAAQFKSPTNIELGTDGNFYVSDGVLCKIKKISPSGVVTTIAGNGSAGDVNGVGTNAQFSNPRGIAQDAAGNLYITDMDNHKIKKIAPNGTVTTFAGSTQGHADGTGTNARFDYPAAIAIGPDGYFYVADRFNFMIRKISPDGVVTTLAGNSAISGDDDGVGSAAKFYNPYDLVVDASGNVYVIDRDNSKIRKVSPSGQVTTVAGSTPGNADGTGSAAQFSYPRGIAIDGAGNLYVSDYNNHRIRKVTF
jgi:sugar lactone lactonase YvrE